MRWDTNDADRRRSHPGSTADVVARLRRRRARAAVRPLRQREATQLLASFGMIGGLLLFWAMAVTM